MFDRSEILRQAWAGYRDQVRDLNRPFSRKLFSSYLAAEWRHAKGRAYLEAQVAAEAKDAAAVRAIRGELRAMEMSDAPINWNRHRELNVALFRASTEIAA